MLASGSVPGSYCFWASRIRTGKYLYCMDLDLGLDPFINCDFLMARDLNVVIRLFAEIHDSVDRLALQ
jgi:hypothetical protein